MILRSKPDQSVGKLRQSEPTRGIGITRRRWWSLSRRLVALMLVALILMAPSARPAKALSGTEIALIVASAAPILQNSELMKDFWQLLADLPKICKAIKKAVCASCLGQIIDGALAPITLATGGCIKCCPVKPDAEDLAKPGAAGACAQLVKDTLEAAERIDYLRCMASVDCRYWPEAENGIINYLRADKNECVRLYAAIVLGNGCCCTAKTVEALKMSATGSNKDGNPSEPSPRVRAASLQAINNCFCHYGNLIPTEAPQGPQPPESPTATPPASIARGGPGSPGVISHLFPNPAGSLMSLAEPFTRSIAAAGTNSGAPLTPPEPPSPRPTRTQPMPTQPVAPFTGHQEVLPPRGRVVPATPPAVPTTSGRSVFGVIKSAWKGDPLPPRTSTAPVPSKPAESKGRFAFFRR
ncbi:hypothetical protein Pan216_26430 [Planctomycetes bacterium Pan216]|uniref:Uncharacterized protein n=1 Tax=Kolteria novifilia TaxID=2527975 RepID=A0A518B471_9BACT|nr:hypothetical protein Pan216_26430 [Planctomycetes bacterium Pan216]